MFHNREALVMGKFQSRERVIVPCFIFTDSKKTRRLPKNKTLTISLLSTLSDIFGLFV